MSVSLLQLWMPILLGGFLAWMASAIIHIFIKYHNADYKGVSNEDEVLRAIANGSSKPGIYTLPYCSDMKQMGEESMIKKFNEGPVAMLTVFQNGMPPMGKLMLQQISFFLLGCLLIGYCASLSLGPSADYMSVFRVISAISFVTFGWAVIPFSIWYGHPWSNTARYLLDALIYSLIVAGSFAWLWPAG